MGEGGCGSGQQRAYGPGGMEMVSGKAEPRIQRAADPDPGRGGGWGLGDPEMKRKKRIARYKAYSVEGKVKASLRRGLHWIKTKCSQMIHGY